MTAFTSGLRRQHGQASAEFLIGAVGILIALAVISMAGRERCIDNFAGDLGTSTCQDVSTSVAAALQNMVEDVTFLINLPF